MTARTSASLAVSLLALVTLATPGCGVKLDLGSNPPVGCEVAQGQHLLTEFASLPGFVPDALLLLGNDAYVGGNLEGASNEGARGRLLRVSLSSGKVEEVWRGANFAAPLRTFEGRIAFVEHDRDGAFFRGKFGGLHVFDTKTRDFIDVPLGNETDYVSDFELGEEGIVYTGVHLADAGESSEARSIVRFDGISTRTIFRHGMRDPRFFRRATHVMVELAVDETETGFDDFDSSGSRLASYSIGDRGIALERRLVEVGTYPSPFGHRIHVVHADSSYYFVTESHANFAPDSTIRIPGPGGEAFVSSTPIFAGNQAYFVAPLDRAMIRRREVEGSDRVGEEVAYDPRRQVRTLDVDACRIVWLSDSNVEPDSHRLMVAPR